MSEGPESAPPPAADPDRTFSAPWEGRSFALVVLLHEAGLFSWRDWTDQLSSELADKNESEQYYGCWLAALERMLIRTGQIDAQEMEVVRRETLDARPHPDREAYRTPIARDPPSDATR